MAGETGLFVYGLVPSDVEATSDAAGVGDPPGDVTVIRHGDLGALVSEVPLDAPLGRSADLRAYQELLDGTAAVAPVLPVRFGTVVTGPDAVLDLLRPHHDRFAAALAEFEGRVQYVVHGRFDERALLRGILDENPAAARLAEQVRGRAEAASREPRIRLGELISQAVELRREAENRRLLDVVADHVSSTELRPPSHEMDAVHVALLVDSDRANALVDALEEFAQQRRGLLRLRLLGPLAPYDFVAAHQLAG
ncbi:GvpL/GvpF family gas vesicle protein [Micromonospora sp. WMMD1120]|uniref:GvpL/GvpF family gas vesicle protein n=1 Tax=Micromonospora sp. WMMD1120 TaxID=3016106 RepID=UPI002417753B|nr:GvpL/GvpF family gas vesicle protein [Micromonospora sp. WMMD1120]MDG4806524.1 GvpL/GvpF family gas vesicle protein [Micromonospora sp. WMMD1120]